MVYLGTELIKLICGKPKNYIPVELVLNAVEFE
jgi:hypothetical protein